MPAIAEAAPRHVLRALPIVIAAGCAIAMLSNGPRTTMGLFLTPVTDAHGWSRESFALAIAVQNIMWGFGQPVAGAFADRYGAGRVLAAGGLIYAAGIGLIAWAPTLLWLHLSAGVLMGVGMSAASFYLVLSAFGRRVPAEKRSFYFGVATAASSLGQFLFAPIGIALIAGFGWAQALLVLAMMMLLIPLLAIPLAGRPGAGAALARDETVRQVLGQAMRHGSYLLLTAGFFVCGFHVAFILMHLPPYLADIGISATIGGWALGVIGLFNIVGSLGSGWLAQSWSKANLLASIYFGRAIVFTAFVLLPPSPAATLVFAALIGLLWLSTVAPTSGLVAAMFGPKHLGMLTGIVFMSHQLGAFLGVWLGGRIYDETGSYDLVWWISVALGIFAGIVHLPIRERPAGRPEALPSAA